MIDGTVNSMVNGLGKLCGASGGSSPCMEMFDKGFRQCVTAVGVVPDNFFKMLADQPLPNGVSKDSLKQATCQTDAKNKLIQCATVLVGQIKKTCENQDTIIVGTMLQNMMGAHEAVCTGKPYNPDQCVKTFEDGLNVCAKKILNLESKVVLMVLQDKALPPGQDGPALKKTICGKWKELEMCGKDVILAAGCARNQLLQVEAMFANIMITVATTCNIQSIPGACLLKLEKNFGECYGKVGLSPDIYLSNDTEHAGSLIGANEAEAEVYCKKKHDLFTCMQEVVNNCKGAEQTLSLTGFDLHAMERAVGLLCRDVPDYLAGLRCFKQPSEAARVCMEKMAMTVTDLSTKQISQGLKMDKFFEGFCSARVEHVACDGAAWPECDKAAIDLKNRFECNLIPSRCYDSHKDHIDEICADSAPPMPNVHEPKKQDELPDCAKDIQNTMGKCFQSVNMSPDLFLINVTDDRRNFIGDADKAKQFCSSRNSVFQCMRQALKSCPHAEHVLAFWGHEQDALEEAVDVVCNALPVYTKGLSCFSNGDSKVRQCTSNTRTKLVSLVDKQVEKKLSSDLYFRDFCSIRVEHLRCDLNVWSGSCEDDVIGLKTEFECKLIQEHCKNLQVSNFKQICNDDTYNGSPSGGSGSSLGGSGGTSGTKGTSANQGGSGSSAVSAQILAVLASVFASVVFLF
ncbi:hypothetical protein ACF0H5_019109 [Mactra antiquata]